MMTTLPPSRSPLRAAVLASAVVVTLAAALGGCSDIPSEPAPGEPPIAGGERPASLRWNEAAREAFVRRGPSQFAAWRAMAYLSLAQHAAVEGALERPGATRAAVRGAVAGASAALLTFHFAAESAAVQAMLGAEEGALPAEQRDAYRSGVTLGRAVGALAVARARGDRFDTVWTSAAPTGAWVWRSSATPPAPPAFPLLGEMRPFFLTSGRQFRPGPPPMPGGPAFAEALAEVRRISDARTPQQDSIARFWALATGTLVAGFWNAAAGDRIVRAGIGERAAAHALALVNATAMDALIACHDAKYAYWLLRPTQADPAIRLAIGLPNFPAYPSNHACASGAAADVLAELFPADRQALSAMASDAAVSRVYGGIHFRFDADTGLALARRVSAAAIEADRRGALRTMLR